MTEVELAAIEARATAATNCRNCGSSLDVDPAEDEQVCPVHGYCWHCMTRGRHGQECRQSCTDVPVLVAEVRRARAALERVRDNGMGTARTVYGQDPDLPDEVRPFCGVCYWYGEAGKPFEHDPDNCCGIAQAALAG